MSDFLKKGFLLGLGAAVSSKEKFDAKLKDLVDRNEMTRDQAKSVMQDFMDKGEQTKDGWSTKQYEQTQGIVKELGLATKDDINELQARIRELESKLKVEVEE